MVIVGGHPGAHVVEMIEQQDGVACAPVWVQSQTRTITTVLEEPIHRQTAFFEPGSCVTASESDAIVETFRGVISEARVVTFNGTVCDRSIEGLYGTLIPIAKERGVLTILDSHGPEFARGLDAVPYMVKPNVAETEELVGYALDTDDAKARAIRFFHEKGVELVVLSLGKDGALVSRGGERFHVVPPAIQEVNPVGSGDALMAGFASGLLEDMPPETMARLAVAAGAANAQSWDIGHFTKEEVEDIEQNVTVRRI
jgi:tagatose 6-phosphate kinase